MTVSSSRTPKSGPLGPQELATAAVMSSFTVALTVIGVLVPMAAILQVVAAVPMSVVALRYRTRALLTAAVAGTLVGFVAAGTQTALTVASAALLGGLVGRAKRKKQGLFGVLVTSMVVGPALGALTVLLLLILVPLRTLFLDTLRNTLEGVSRLLERTSALQGAADVLRSSSTAVLDNWWWWVGGSIAFGIVTGTLFAWLILTAILDRLSTIPTPEALVSSTDDDEIGPLPVTLASVGYRYPGSATAALTGVDLHIEHGEFVAIVGHNGSGKSTLTRIIAGLEPSEGTVSRPGATGLGRYGGTAMVLQRPESQILGTRVADDVVWGLPPGDSRPDVEALLVEVGLGGMGARDTASLSGGEMQRLAVAAALARRPALLIADEATAMIDASGREHLVSLLAELPRRHGMSVVLVTHHVSETVAADRVVHLHEGYQVQHDSAWMQPSTVNSAVLHDNSSQRLLEVVDVQHTYNRRTPWAQVALNGIDITVKRGEGVLVLGGNGSGKSTLAWIMAGLTGPTKGTAQLDGKAMTTRVGDVGLAFQHSRLQLQRRTVSEDIAAAAGPETGSATVSSAMDAVGLDRSLAARDIDSLSGGQMRRVVLAGLIARRPRVLVLDEPLAGLDPPGRDDIIGVLAGLRERGVAIVVISHDVDGMDTVCSRTITMSDGHIVSDSILGRVPS
ncbi:ABC transporter ATP-binding protein [Rhodococcus sp. Leaf278]|uniref:ABC transporter ATP-binding protein n=1 Tax=Rhodococcus sp. Leaf278 TaxID=1736319 RepID=UPI00190FCE35|nr:ATP-binding cassette domain-containing protein [Rhodococcus sp. Leaf278]